MEKYIEISKLKESLEAVAYRETQHNSAFNEGFRAGIRKAACMLAEESAANVTPVCYARWEEFNLYACGCSKCGGTTSKEGIFKKRYCPYCGARMSTGRV